MDQQPVSSTRPYALPGTINGSTSGLISGALTQHLHDVAIEEKRGFSDFVHNLVIQHQGQASLTLQLENHQWQGIPGLPGVSVRHIERHPSDPDLIHLAQDKTDCTTALPHLNTFALEKGSRGVLLSHYHARLTMVSGTIVANGVLVTANDRARAEYRSTPDEQIEFEVVEFGYCMVRYFADLSQVPEAGRGRVLTELLAEQKGKPWYEIYASTNSCPA